MDTQQTWPRCPEAAAFFETHFRTFAAANPVIEEMAARFADRAGVSLADLVDHWAFVDTPEQAHALLAWGFVATRTRDGDAVWQHPGARLPRVRLEVGLTAPRLALRVESVTEFLERNPLAVFSRHGNDDSAYSEARCSLPHGELAIVARWGYEGFQPNPTPKADRTRLEQTRATLANRDRSGDETEVCLGTETLFRSIADDIGADRATDEFFRAERAFYLARNRAARWQYEQQLLLGIGWANHDHHTYRSARTGFRALMRLWRAMGFEFRERFYAGAEAGWGAQILEHPISRVVLFCDLDVAPDELDIDYGTVDLQARDTLGTIGLWCALHGSSIGAAGMHHLEAEFDWERARAGLQAAGWGVMAPFTNQPILKQAFTEAEIWPVARERVEALRARDLITAEQAEQFLAQGAPGSHLEILQRWEGFKGFNKTGVSAIIRETDARRPPSPRPPATPPPTLGEGQEGGLFFPSPNLGRGVAGGRGEGG